MYQNVALSTNTCTLLFTNYSEIKLIFFVLRISFFFIAEEEWIWGILTLSWVALGYLSALTAVTIGKFRDVG